MRAAIVSALVSLALIVALAAAPAGAVGTAFTYQGQLSDSGVPSGATSCDFQFSLFNDASGGTQLGSTQTVNAVALTNGVFSVELNGAGQFGAGAFDGGERWLQISARCPAGAGSFVGPFSPRQKVTATPYALYSEASATLTCTDCVGTTQLAGNAVTGAKIAAGTITSTQIADGTITEADLGAIVLPISKGGTGATGAAAARANLAAAASGANSDITSLSGITGNIDLPNATNITIAGAPFMRITSSSSGGNTALGASALANNTANSNTAVGFQALFSNVGGTRNTALGRQALATNAGGSDNTAVGHFALGGNSSGNQNTAVGQQALEGSSSGGSNTAVGYRALLGGGAGGTNTALGALALGAASGSNNIAIGALAGSLLTTGSNNIAIGHAGAAAVSNVIRIGTSQTSTFIAGISGQTSSSGVSVLVNSSGKLGTTTSSARYKENVRDIATTSNRLLELRPVSFQYKRHLDPDGLTQYGLIAEEVAEVFPELVVYGDDGEPHTVRYHFLSALLLGELQRQQRGLQAQAKEIEHLRAQTRKLDALQARLDAVEMRLIQAKPSFPAPVEIAQP